MEAETKTCCVTGHRDIPAEKKGLVEEALRREVAAAIEVLAPGDRDHILSGVFNQFLSALTEPVE